MEGLTERRTHCLQGIQILHSRTPSKGDATHLKTVLKSDWFSNEAKMFACLVLHEFSNEDNERYAFHYAVPSTLPAPLAAFHHLYETISMAKGIFEISKFYFCP